MRSRRQIGVATKRPRAGEKTKGLPDMFIMTKEMSMNMIIMKEIPAGTIIMKETMPAEQIVVVAEKTRARTRR
jgi:hypothetical protein